MGDKRVLTFDEESVYPALGVPLRRGADFAEVFFEDKAETRIDSDGERVCAASLTHMRGAGLYLLSGQDTRYGYTNDASSAGISALADDISSALAWDSPAPAREPLELGEARAVPSPNAIALDPTDVPLERKKAVLLDICRRARGFDARIVDAHADYQDRVQNVAVLNSEGLLTRERRVITTLRLYVTAAEDGRSNANWSNYSMAAGFECLEDEGRRAAMVAKTCGAALNGLRAVSVAPEVMPVVVDSGTFIHEDCGHPLESTHLAGGASVFYGKIGQRVASPLVTILDDGTQSGLCGSAAISDEGVASAPNLLIEDGVLRGYMVDRLGSRQLGMAQTAAGRRQDYRFAPVARMTNTYMRAGTTPNDSIIPSVSHGLYVSEVGGGNVNPTTGNFNFLVASGYLIENGELTYPIANINLSGQSIDALMRVAAVGDTYHPDDGSLCGADSGLIYVTAYMPRVLIDGMLVG
ncbi:MAG: TldD/PmbA family protein [Coriobacteriia bacterium]|nr:TldD/PmbA family protein [Coriobacteriia bacterium]